jgi:hypothetical protein
MITPGRVRELLLPHGECTSQPESDWSGSIPLPDAARDFYRDVGPVGITIEGYGNPTFLPSLSTLWAHQAGYRWDGRTGEPVADWDSDWLVVADEGADPFILSISRGSILYAEHGTGAWEPDEIYPDLLTMAACMAALGTVVLEAGQALTDDESCIRPQYRSLAISRLSSLLGSESDAEAVVSGAGWGAPDGG